MKFTDPVREGQFLKRYKRFFADVRLDQEVVVSHVPNTGSLKSCLFADAPCVVTMSSDPKRKLKATLQFVRTPTGWVGVNTQLPNTLVYEAWENKTISHWREFSEARPEVKISADSRIDLVLSRADRHHYVEVKNVTLTDGRGTAQFPDAVTTRGQKHLRELMQLREQGHGAEIVFVVQRQDCDSFAPADEIDPEYGRLIREAHDKGVLVSAYACDINPLAGVSLATHNAVKLRL